ncbi:hypothetical protein IFR05_011331 [Cadophora sp. M221]|nr:hypothetical protein IFR05_011331 [Cadophora sp. M221]
MALSQIWNGNPPLPPPETINISINNHHAWVRGLGTSKGDSVVTGIVRPGPWYAFLNRAAGTGVDEKLGYELQGWKFWVEERKLSGLMMRGVMTPFMYRLFDERRKRWEGAREAILHANELAGREYGKKCGKAWM